MPNTSRVRVGYYTVPTLKVRHVGTNSILGYIWLFFIYISFFSRLGLADNRGHRLLFGKVSAIHANTSDLLRMKRILLEYAILSADSYQARVSPIELHGQIIE